MKKLFLILAAFVGLAVMSCTPEVDMTLDRDSLTFSANGGSEVITVTGVASGIQASADQAWCTTSVSGSAVTINVAANEADASRTATVTISYRSTERTVSVTQEGLSADFSGLPESVNVPFGGGTVTLGKVVANVDVKVNIPAAADWVTNPQVAEDGTITVEAAANSGMNERNCVVTVEAGAAKQEVTLTQGAVTFSVDFDPQVKGFSGRADVELSITLAGDATDYRFMVFPEGSYSSYDEIKAILNDDERVGDDVYDREVVSLYGTLGNGDDIPDVIQMRLDVNVTYTVAGYAMDESGATSDLVTKNFTTDPDSPVQIYNKWIGDWEFSFNTFDGDLYGTDAFLSSRVPAKDTISIVADQEGFTYLLLGWEDISYTADEEGNIAYTQMHCSFDTQTYDMVMMTGAFEPALQIDQNGTAVPCRMVPCLPIEYAWDASQQGYSVSMYILQSPNYIMAKAAYQESFEGTTVQVTPTGVTDSTTGQVETGYGITVLIITQTAVDNDNVTQADMLGFATSIDAEWLYAYSMTKISDTPTMTPAAAAMAATSFYGQLNAPQVGNPQFFTNASNFTVTNEPVKVSAR